MKVLVIGDVGLDYYTIGEVRRISPEAPVPILNVTKEEKVLGLAGNVVANLAALETDSTLISIVGIDKAADSIEHFLDNLRVNHTLIRTKCPTTTKERVITTTQQICRIDREDTQPIDYTTEEAVLDAFDHLVTKHHGVIIQDYCKGLLNERIISHIILSCKELRIPVAVDPGKKTDPRWYFGADIIKPNLQEAREIIEKLGQGQLTEWKAIAQVISNKLSIPNVLITMGSGGMGLHNERGDLLFEAIQKRVVDVSGAGDTVIATLMSCYLETDSITTATHWANQAAGIVVGKRGTSTVTRKELLGE